MSVGVSRKENVLTFSINVPEARNALDLPTVADLRKVLADVRDDPDLRLVVMQSGLPGVFSLGMNLEKLDEQQDLGVWESLSAIAGFADLLIDLATMPVPTVSVVDGIAAAGGVELACVCDILIGTNNAAFSIAQLRKGIFPFITSAVLVPRIGHGRFLHWALSGQSYPAKKLLDLGLIHQLCSPDERERSVSLFSERILGFEPATLRAGVAALRMEAEAEIRGRIRHALSLFTLNCLAKRSSP